MTKKILIRFYHGFVTSIAITLLIDVALMMLTGEIPLLPEYSDHFVNPVCAFGIQLILVGLMSGITSAGTVVFETRKPGILVQSGLFLVIMLSGWIPVACFVWGFHKYIPSMISTLASILVTYIICWIIQYHHCRKEIEDINQLLQGTVKK